MLPLLWHAVQSVLVLVVLVVAREKASAILPRRTREYERVFCGVCVRVKKTTTFDRQDGEEKKQKMNKGERRKKNNEKGRRNFFG